MYILYPHVQDDLPSLIKNLKSDILTTFKKMKEYKQVTIGLPKFKFEGAVDYVPTFKQLGIRKLFNQNGTQNASFVSNVLQKITINVNENGSNRNTSSG